MFLLSSIVTIVLLFLLSLLMPVLSFALPIYKIKKMKNFTPRERLIVNIVVLIVITSINHILAYFYVGFFLMVEFLYYFFNIRLSNVKKFDRIVITSIVVTILMGLLLYFIRDDINNNVQLLMETYEKNLQITRTKSLEMFQDIKASSLAYIFIYSILNIFMMYISLDINNYQNWKISFEWLLIYIIGYFAIYLLKIDNFYINNLYSIGETIFTFYGIKSLYALFCTKIKYKRLSNMLAVIFALLFPFGTFIFGVLEGFGIDKYIKKR